MGYEIKPLSVGEILDGAFQLYRNHFAAFFTVVAVIAVPAVTFGALVGWAVTGTFAPVTTPQAAGLGRFWLVILVSAPVTFGLYILQNSVLTIAIADAYLGRTVSVAAAFRRAVRLLGSLSGAAVLTGLGVWGGMILLVVPGILLALRWLFTVQAITVEGLGASASLKRSRQLTTGRRLRLAGLVLLITIITVAINFGAAAVIPNAVLALPVIGPLLRQLPTTVLAPLYPAVLTLAYFDARVRSEAFDLEMLARTIGGGPPAAVAVAARTV